MSNIVRKPMIVTPENTEECAKELDKYLDENIVKFKYMCAG